MLQMMYRIMMVWLLCVLPYRALAAVDTADLLPAEEAFRASVVVDQAGATAHFKIAKGYYLYQAKIVAQTEPGDLLAAPTFSPAQKKEDEFFGRQLVFHDQAEAHFAYLQAAHPAKYRLILQYQGCAEAGVCYPPVKQMLEIDGEGVYGNSNSSNRLTAPSQPSFTPTAPPPAPKASPFTLSRDTLSANLLAFFVFGMGLSLTACMYPLIPIVSSMIVGQGAQSKRRGFALSVAYVQGLALTYATVGVIAGLTGALLTVWLQQPWVVLTAAALMVVLALGMFDVIHIQLPATWQSFFQQRSSRLTGGRLLSVFAMGMVSALIVGPCVAPPLALALGYIGQTGDALLGGLALYAMALGTGVPLILVGTLGGHILPRAGAWMNGVKYAFGVILLAVAVYLATPFLPYLLTAMLYTLLLVIPSGLLLTRRAKMQGAMRWISGALALALLALGSFFALQSYREQTTFLHQALVLFPKGNGSHFKPPFHSSEPAKLTAQMKEALANDEPVLLDFYADWCVSCREMEAHTLNQPEVAAALPLNRFYQLDVTDNTAEQQAFLRQYSLYGPPGLFVLYPDGSASMPLIGFATPAELISWYRAALAEKAS